MKKNDSTNNSSGNLLNESANSKENSVIIGQEDLDELVKELDVEAIRREVFNLYNVKFGLDTQLALRKMQVLESEDMMF